MSDRVEGNPVGPAIDAERVLVTGANGALGRQLFAALAGGKGRAAAVVRSENAADTLRELDESIRPEIRTVSYVDTDGLARAMEGRDLVVHLVGILKETKHSRYRDAHEKATAAVAAAAAKNGVKRVVYLSILGSEPGAENRCLASKGRAEQLLLGHEVPATVIRLPMVLGQGDAASRALRGQAHAKVLPLIGGGRSLEQPIDADDVIAAVLAAAVNPALDDHALDLAGPESLRQRELITRAAALYGKKPRIVSLPEGAVRFGVHLLERFSGEPPITSPMLDVLLHDDHIDPEPAARALGIRLTPLDEMLARRVGPDAPGAPA